MFGRKAIVAGVAVAAGAAAGGTAMAGSFSAHPVLRPDRHVVSVVHHISKPAAGGPSGPVDPAMFSPGACVALAPVHGDRHRTVFLDAGHGGLDPGGVGVTRGGATVEEAQVNLRIELDAAALLRARGYRVVISRTGQSGVARLTPAMVSGRLLTAAGVHDDVTARDVCANLARAGILIGIYLNAGAPGGAGSVSLYDTGRPFSAANRVLATLLQRDVLAAMNARGWGIPDGGVRPDTGMGSAITSADAAYGHLLLLGPPKAGYFSTPSTMPGALIEPLFVTDPFEASIAASARGQQVIAAAIAEAAGQYLGGAGRGHPGDVAPADPGVAGSGAGWPTAPGG